MGGAIGCRIARLTGYDGGMKRPQFSLKMLLLVTALVASIIGWRVAVNKQHVMTDRDWSRDTIEGRINMIRALIKDAEAHPTNSGHDIKSLQNELMVEEQKLENLP